jgi:hypothetical protein
MSGNLFRKFDTFPDRFVKWGFGAYFLAKILKVLLIIPFLGFWIFWLIFYDEYLEYKEKKSMLDGKK